MVSLYEIDDAFVERMARLWTALLYGLIGALILAAITLCVVFLFQYGHLTWLAYEIGAGSCPAFPPL